MKILITGANGNLGRQLIRRLCDGPVDSEPPRVKVRALVRSENAARVVDSLPVTQSPELIVGDYSDAAFMREAIEDCQFVVHLVGIIKEGATANYHSAHEQTCSVLADVSLDSTLQRIVYVSILGSRPDAANACLASKGRAEQILHQGSCPSTVLRVPMVLGPDDYASASLRRQGCSKFVALVGGGVTLQQPIDCDDVVKGILAAIHTQHGNDEDFDLAGPECLTHRDLVRRAGQLHGQNPLIVAIPTSLARLFVGIAERLGTNPAITRSMFEILQCDDCVDQKPCCRKLGISLTPLDNTLGRYVGPESRNLD
ncbi:MAG: NAD(P)H-binding protein [Myxococcota bacterium]